MDDFVAQAVGQPDPVRWIRARIVDALERIEDGGYDEGQKAEVKRELFTIEREVIATIGRKVK